MTLSNCSLAQKHCVPCEGGTAALTDDKIDELKKQLSVEWDVTSKVIFCDFKFKNYYQTMAFVNAIAWMAHAENHHPDLEVSYNHCLVKYSTHAIDGLSENDFICAEMVNLLYKQKG
jgi:4a-hydroxytetrahydrobiopterin dehydratase